MRIISFTVETSLIKKILKSIDLWNEVGDAQRKTARDPPHLYQVRDEIVFVPAEDPAGTGRKFRTWWSDEPGVSLTGVLKTGGLVF